uniref:Uncharacterized protein LOC111130635 isoform X2 n=1 Tax=Crassostrea virginica TaxID=6565 RepID=A0A8B8E127_CRAVI|nr:uncharacterized protein LOC111130635 isoform X2 [Crassostrea virginica]
MMRCWRPLLVILHFYLCQSAVVLQPSSTTENKESKATDILRQLLNQETLIRLSLSRDVQSLLQQQRTSEKTDQAVKKTLVDLQASVQRLTNVTDDLNLRNENLTNELFTLIRNNQEKEKTEESKLGALELRLERLSNQTTQQSLFNGDLNSGIKNVSSLIAGVKTDLLGNVDALVQGACAAAAQMTDVFISAVRRTCSDDAPSCDQVCKNATSQMKSKGEMLSGFPFLRTRIKDPPRHGRTSQ